ncbi:MAG: hypothetical protein DUD28_13615, partial [Lactobacillus sp.]
FLLAQLIDIFDHSRLPSTDKPTYKRFNQFQVDDKLPILAADMTPSKKKRFILRSVFGQTARKKS